MGAGAGILDLKADKPSLRFQENLRVVLETHGKSYPDQIREILSLRRGAGRIDPFEYYMYGPYDDARFSPDDKHAFVGRKMMARLTSKYFKDAYTAETVDKIVFHDILARLGVRGPRTHAVYLRKVPGTAYRGVETIAGRDALVDYLRRRAPYPLFSKPIDQAKSLGIAAVDSYEPGTDSIVMADGRSVAVGQYVDEIQSYAKGGYLFQERLAPHPTIERLCGRRICTVRVLVIMERGEPVALRASLKIPAGRNQADNFWRAGNILGGIDIATGVVARAVERGGPREVVVARHPDTGAPIEGFVVSDWDAVKALCLKAAPAFAASPVQGWDIALCAGGPLVLELEGNGGHPMLTQLPLRKGWLDERFKRHLEACIRKD